jgi:hypothetical protein
MQDDISSERQESAAVEKVIKAKWRLAATLGAIGVFIGAILAATGNFFTIMNYIWPRQSTASANTDQANANASAATLPHSIPRTGQADTPAIAENRERLHPAARTRLAQPAPPPAAATVSAGRDAYSVLVNNSPNANTNTTFNISQGETER